MSDEPAPARRPRRRSAAQRVLDFASFPLRALTLFHEDACGLSSLATERYDYVARAVSGRCLDVGCGRHNRFIAEFHDGPGVGIDLFPYEGLGPEHLVESLLRLPFPDGSFDAVTFIANLNHCPRPDRDAELAEAFRVLRPGGTIVVTMGHPVAEILVHQVVRAYDAVLGTKVDMDTERGMEEDEEYYLTDHEIRERLTRAGFVGIVKHRFTTQWGLNALFRASRPDAAACDV